MNLKRLINGQHNPFIPKYDQVVSTLNPSFIHDFMNNTIILRTTFI